MHAAVLTGQSVERNGAADVHVQGAYEVAAVANTISLSAALIGTPREAQTESLYEQHVRRAKQQSGEQKQSAPTQQQPLQRVGFRDVDDEQTRRRELKQRRHAAATHIQACYRRRTVSQTLTALNHLATIIQAGARGRQGRMRAEEKADTRQNKSLISEVQRVELANRWAGVLDPSPPPPPPKHWRERAPLQRKRRPTPNKRPGQLTPSSSHRSNNGA